MDFYSMDKLCLTFEKGVHDNADREILGQSLFYYCSGKDAAPIIAFGHDYPLYVYADIIGYGNGDFDEETRQLYQRITDAGFRLMDKRKINIGKNAVLTMWSSPQQKTFFLLYVGHDAVQTFKKIYSDNNNYIKPKCICNYRYELPEDARSFFETIEKRTDYILGHCFIEKYRKIAEYAYGGDYGENETVPLFRRMFWYVF